MRDLKALRVRGEQHGVLPNHASTAQGGKADIAALAGASVAITDALRCFLQRHAAAGSSRLAEHQCRAGGGIDLHPVMHFQHLNIKVGIEGFGNAARDGGQQVNSHTHITGLDDGRVASGGVQGGMVGLAQARGADDVHDASVGREPRKRDGRLGDREIEHGIDRGKDLQGVIRDENARWPNPGQHARVLPEQTGALLLDGAGQCRAFGGADGFDELAAHAAGGTRYGNLHGGHILESDIGPLLQGHDRAAQVADMKLMLSILAALALATPVSPAFADTRPGALPDLRVTTGKHNIAEAWFADATTRYQHYVLGSNYEAATLMVRLRDGKTLKLTLPDTAVFEDREPRFADLDGDGTDEMVVVKSYLSSGAALAIVAVRDGALQIIAETPPTGRANTWRNPAGIADFDGDGRLDIAEVQMPHVLGKLRVWTLRDGKLVEIATTDNVSNHQGGSPHLRLAAVADVDGDGTPDLIIPTLDRSAVRVITLKGGLRELARKALPGKAVSNVAVAQAGRAFTVTYGGTITAVIEARSR